MKRGKKKKTLNVFNRFSGLPKVLIWGWAIWSVSVITTLLVIYAPPLHSVKETAISLISSISKPDKENQPVLEIGSEEKSDIGKIDRHTPDTNLPASKITSDVTSDDQNRPDTTELSSNQTVTTDEISAVLPDLPANQSPPVSVLIQEKSTLVDTLPDLNQKESKPVDTLPDLNQEDSLPVNNLPDPYQDKPTLVDTLPDLDQEEPLLVDTLPDQDKEADDAAFVRTPTIDSNILKSTATDLKFFRSHPDAVSRSPSGNKGDSVVVDQTTEISSINESNIIKTTFADLKYFRSHPDVVYSRVGRNIEKVDKIKAADDTDPSDKLIDDQQEVLLVEQKQPVVTPDEPGPSKPTEDTPAVGLADRKQFSEHKIKKPDLPPVPTPLAPNDTDSVNENITPRIIETIIERFTTYDWRRQTAEWEKLTFKGVDHKGRVVEMALLVLSDKFYWRFGGQSVINNDGQAIRLSDHLASKSLKTAIIESKGIVSIGTASEEGDLRLEEYRANKRAERLISLVLQTQPQINAIYTLSLGQYQKTGLTNEREPGPSSNDQRRIILISITHQDPNANLADAIKDGLSGIPGLPYELSHFSHFDLKNKASAF